MNKLKSKPHIIQQHMESRVGLRSKLVYLEADSPKTKVELTMKGYR